MRLGTGQNKCPGIAPDLTALNTPELAALLNHPNSWHRDTALRALESNKDLRATRGLHPSTALHKMWEDKTNAPLTRLNALWALHRVNLLDDDALENGATDSSPLLRAWSARLFGERKYPTGTAFKMLEKMAHDTKYTVRTAVAIAARQFVSGSFIKETAPPIPIREVWTGGILSTLWFSTEKGSTPEFDLLFWNAVKPICAFDAGHPLGFFSGEREEKMALPQWLIVRITRQVAETGDPLKQEDAILMLTQLKPANHHMLALALEGLESGSPNRKVTPTQKPRDTLEQFPQSPHPDVATLAKEILADWNKPTPSH